jgi:hypothetical protein
VVHVRSSSFTNFDEEENEGGNGPKSRWLENTLQVNFAVLHR